MFRLHLRRTLIFLVIGLALAAVVALVTPKLYLGQTDLLLSAPLPQKFNTPVLDEVRQILNNAQPQDLTTEVGILRGRGVFQEAALRGAAERRVTLTPEQIDALFLMYDITATDVSQTISILVKTNDPELSAAIANQIPVIYGEIRGRAAKESITNAQSLLNGRVLASESQLVKQQAALRQFKEDNNITDLAVDTTQRVQYATALQQSRDRAAAELAGAESSYNAAVAELSKVPSTIPNSSSRALNPLVNQLEGQLATLLAQRSELEVQFTSGSPDLKAVNDKITTIQRQLQIARNKPLQDASVTAGINPLRASVQQRVVEAKVQLDNLRSQVADLDTQVKTFDAKVSVLPKLEQELVRRNREIAVLDATYRDSKAQSEVLATRTGALSQPAIVLAPAQALPDPVAPNVPRLLIFGGFAGLLLGLLVSFSMEALSQRLYSSAQISALTGFPVISVPQSIRGDLQRALGALSKPGFNPAESFRFMAFTALGEKGVRQQVNLVTSVGRGVGSQSCAAQFAISLARTGVKTILVDCEFRQHELSDAFGAISRPGLRNLLERSELPAADEIGTDTNHANLYILPIGQGQGGSITDYQTNDVEAVFEALKQQYEAVVLLAAPCDLFADASRLARYAGMTFLVASANTTQVTSLSSAAALLQMAGATETTIVLTQSSPRDEPFSGAPTSSAAPVLEPRA